MNLRCISGKMLKAILNAIKEALEPCGLLRGQVANIDALFSMTLKHLYVLPRVGPREVLLESC